VEQWKYAACLYNLLGVPLNEAPYMVGLSVKHCFRHEAEELVLSVTEVLEARVVFQLSRGSIKKGKLVKAEGHPLDGVRRQVGRKVVAHTP
jgi:hypothetical protein